MKKIMNIKYIPILILIIVMGLTMGYSAYNKDLFVSNITSEVRIKKDVRITGISVSSFTSETISNYEEYNVNKLSISMSLPSSDSSITYKVSVTNLGNTNVGIANITGFPDNLEYEISNYNLKDKICDDNNNCNLGITKELYIVIRYKNGSYDSSNTNYNVNLSFDFRNIYTISYTGIDDVSNYPSEVLEGDSLSITFEDPIPSIVSISETNDYLYSNGQLIVNNVTSNLTIDCKMLSDVDFPIQGDGNEISITDEDISSGNPVNVSNYLQKEFEGVNLTNKVITSIDVVTTYTSSSGASQSISCILTTGGNTYTQIVNFLGKRTNATVTVTFSNLNILSSEEFIIKHQNTGLKNGNVRISGIEIIVHLS